MTVADRVRDVVLPLLTERDLDLYDIEVAGPVLKVVVDRPGGLDLDVLADATRAVSRALDEADPIAGAYTLEVSSPGLERRLRTPRHFARAVGETVKVKLTAAGGATRDGERRLEGEVVAADDEGVTRPHRCRRRAAGLRRHRPGPHRVRRGGPPASPARAPHRPAQAGAPTTTTDDKRDEKP